MIDWPASETEAANQKDAGHLWDESWDDGDDNDDFSAQLREEVKKVEASKKR
jgi:26 proteasome complex subunit DSS1